MGSRHHLTADQVAGAVLAEVVSFQREQLRDDVAVLVVEAAP